MHILALAVDYDGTIAEDGAVSAETTDALRRFQQTGRKVLLVTGRQLVDLEHTCRCLDLFDYIVAENGAVLHQPQNGVTEVIASPPPSALVERLSSSGEIPLAVGQSIIATWHPHEHAVVNAIHDLGLEHQIIFNKDAVMVLPANVNKATGLKRALKALDISSFSVAGCGDAENDHSFLSVCGCSAAVANALPSLKQMVDIVLEADHGAGVAQLIDRIIQHDDRILPLSRRGIVAGTDREGEPSYMRPEDVILITGNSGCGKSSYLTLLTERMAAKGHEFCIIDPEGDYLSLKDAAIIGGLDVPPSTEDALRLLLQADINVVVNTMALSQAERKRLFAELMPSIRTMRESSGRPQWLIIDEAHYTLPFPDKPSGPSPLSKSGAIIATVNPTSISPHILREVDVIVAMGTTAEELILQCADLLGPQTPVDLPHLAAGEFIVWPVKSKIDGTTARVLRLEQPAQYHNRHSGKYAGGDVGHQRSFYFQGVERYARNLREFLKIAAKVDDTVWMRHLKANDYSAWFRYVIRDDTLADIAAEIERDTELSPSESRNRISCVIHERYTITE